MKGRRSLAALAAVNAALAVLLAIATNAVANALPRVLSEEPWRAWLLVGVFAIASVGCAVLLVRVDRSHHTIRDREPESGQRLVAGVHVGGDVNVRGSGNSITGGDHNSSTAPPQRPPPKPSRQPRRRPTR